MNDFSTLAELIFYQAKKFNNPKALAFASGNFSNQEFLEKSFYFACGLREMGFVKGGTLANVSNQNPIWLIVDFGAILAGGITVPIFHNISDENLIFEINDAKIDYLFTDDAEILEKKLPIKNIITYGFKKSSISFEELILLGKKAAEEKKYQVEDFVKESKADEVVTIIYTSGSTGTPKGVELTNQNLVSQIKGVEKIFPLDSKSDVALSFLPLAHIFERMVMMFYISQGISVYFAEDIKNLGELLKKIKPTLMTTVPRMLEKVFLRIKDQASQAGYLKKKLACVALERALNKNIDDQLKLLDKIFDILVYKKFRQALGGNMKMMICGGAPLSQDMERFYANIGVNLFCGYGLTETSPVIAVNHYKAHKFATVGKAFADVELKIANDGELLVKGSGVMKAYHNEIKKTNEVISDGWFKTGDLAAIDSEGFLKIIGRKKELFKTANGKYVAPVPIEQKLVQEFGCLIGAIIIAEGRKFTSALLFPDFEILDKFKRKNNCEKMSDEEFLASEILQKISEKIIERINKNLDHWQQIQKFYIVREEISIASGEITPSMKLKRSVLEEKYKDKIEEFYA